MNETAGPFFEFTVIGIPKSVGGGGRKSRKNLKAWTERVRSAALSSVDAPAYASADPLSVRITYYYWQVTDLDVDNIAKPVLDALVDIVYSDDSQVEEVTIRKTDHSRDLGMLDPSSKLAALLYRERHFIHVRCFGTPITETRHDTCARSIP